MINYSKEFAFENELGGWVLHVSTAEHPTSYGNATLLSIARVGVPDKNYRAEPDVYDLRYSGIYTPGDINDEDEIVIEEEAGEKNE